MTKQEEIGEEYCSRLVDGICELGYQSCALTMYHPNCRNRKTQQPDYMATREEIGEGMWEFILEIRQYLCNTEFAPEPFTAPVDLDILREMGNTQLKKMGTQGVVIKVDKPFRIGESVNDDGLVAVEPLIKEGKQ